MAEIETRPGPPIGSGKVIFFDDVCVLCNGVVARLLQIDEKRLFRYSSLRGEFAQSTFNLANSGPVESVVFLSEGQLYVKTDAIIHILKNLGGIYRIGAMVLHALPLFMLNWVYDRIAKNRYVLFGRRETCLVPTPENRDLFIP